MAGTNSPILMVCGLGRCGSSLVMQMLKAGGLKVPGAHPYYELTDDNGKLEWRDKYDAVKWLNPGRKNIAPPPDRTYRCLWLTRDHFQQARSWIKYSKEKRGTEPKSEVDAILKTMIKLRQQEKDSHALIRQVSCEPVPVLRFETILDNPSAVAKGLAIWADRPLDADAMAMVVKPREPECYPTMLEGCLAPSV